MPHPAERIVRLPAFACVNPRCVDVAVARETQEEPIAPPDCPSCGQPMLVVRRAEGA